MWVQLSNDYGVAIELVSFYRWLILILVLVGLVTVVVWLLWSRKFMFYVFFALTIASAGYLLKTHRYAVFVARLSSEDDSLAEATYYAYGPSISNANLLMGIKSGRLSDNAKFYLCLLIRERLASAKIDRDAIAKAVTVNALIHPGFFSTNRLNKRYLSRAINGPAFTELELITNALSATRLP